MMKKMLSLPLKELFPLIEESLRAGQEVYMTVRGNSMSPFLQDGRDQVVFAPLGERKIRRGDIVFYQRDNGQFVMHRVYRVAQDGVLSIVGDAQWTLERGIRPAQLRAFVPRVIRKGKEISCEKGLWHGLMSLYLLRIRFPRLARLGLKILHGMFAIKRRWVNRKKYQMPQ